MFAMGVLYTTAQTMDEITVTKVMGTHNPTVIPVPEAGKAIATWTLLCVRGSGAKSRANDFGTQNGNRQVSLLVWDID